MVVSREFFKPEKGLLREFIYKGASSPNKPRIDYFKRYPEPNAFDDLSFKYTSSKPWIMLNIHCGNANRQNPYPDGIKVNGVVAPFVRGGNQYYEYPAVVSAFVEVTPNQEVTIDVAIGGNGRTSMGNGGIHIKELTSVGDKLQHRAADGSVMGWSVGGPDYNLPNRGWEAGDIVVASVFSANPEAHPVYGYVSKSGDYRDKIMFTGISLNEFQLGAEGYAVGAVDTAFNQTMLDLSYIDTSIMVSSSGKATVAYAFLRGAIL